MKGERLKQYFGMHWGVPALDGLTQADTPIGDKCYWCEEEIVFGDQGLFTGITRGVGEAAYLSIEPVHRECNYRSLLGSLGHHLGMCSCNGGTFEDPQELSRRQAAIAAWRYGTTGRQWPV